MHREGSDPGLMSAEDFLCDYCLNHWTPQRPMVEGHRGSLICGACLSVAYLEVKVRGSASPLEEHETCCLCLTPRTCGHWRSEAPALRPLVCADCIEQAARKLEKDKDCDWTRPMA